MQIPTHAILKDLHRAVREQHATNITLRIHRALSWLDKSESCDDDLDAEFVFLWIAFNSAYSNLMDPSLRKFEKETFGHFLSKICELDQDQSIYNLMWQEFPKSIRVLLDNKYVFQPFWNYHNQLCSEEDWQQLFQKAKQAAHYALGNKLTDEVLTVVFDRLYTLRNQILHGGATWDSSVNRNQMRDATAILRKLIPLIIQIMINHPDQFIGEAVYQVVDE